MKDFLRLNDWENGGKPDAGGPADAITQIEFRGEKVVALLRVVEENLWFRVQGRAGAPSLEWNFRVASVNDVRLPYSYFGGDAVWMRELLHLALQPPSTPNVPRFWRVADRFYFAENGEAFLGNTISWKWQKDFNVDFWSQPAPFWKKRADQYRLRRDLDLVYRWDFGSVSERPALIFEVSPCLELVVRAAMRQCHSLQQQLLEYDESTYQHNFWWGNGKLNFNEDEVEPNWNSSYSSVSQFCPAVLRRICKMALARYPARFLKPQILKQWPHLRPLLGNWDLYPIEQQVLSQSAHEKLEDLLLLREFLRTELSEAETEALLNDLQSEG